MSCCFNEWLNSADGCTHTDSGYKLFGSVLLVGRGVPLSFSLTYSLAA